MSDFGTVTFDRVKQQYADIDVGASALYTVIAQCIQENDPATALEIALEASRIHTVGDTYIVDDVTTNTDVFLEVFRRVLFTPEPEDKTRMDAWRLQITSAAAYLGNVRMYILRQSL